MHKIIIRHEPMSAPPAFKVERPGDRSYGPFAVTPPLGFPVAGSGDAELVGELQWYLEDFLDYPYPPSTDRAERAQATLRDWGRQAFDALFEGRDPAVLLDRAARDGYAQLLIHVWSDDPAILQWPWEALLDRNSTYLALACQIERRLSSTPLPLPLLATLPRDRINILLVTARPHRDDVSYRSISRPLIELVEKEALPASVHLLRPPTFAALREHLRTHQGFYHILHFDGHGGYCAATLHGDHQHCFVGPEGCLLFEKEDGTEDLITASQLSDLLRDYPVPITALNACRSAMIDANAADPFASTATALLKCGTRAVTAMSYSIYVSAARWFVPEFYRALFATGSPAQAMRAGRQKLREQPGRICSRGRFPLQDWMLPVLYQQEDFSLSFAETAPAAERPERPQLPDEASDRANPYGFIGRDQQILELERALRAQVPAILIHGLAGAGKTTLARGLVHWLRSTDGLGAGCLWLHLGEARSAEFVINRMAEQLFPSNSVSSFLVLPLDQKTEIMAKTLHDNKLLVVWDNFEVVAGNPDAGIPPNLPPEDQATLRAFLQKLWNSQTKIIITSRSSEDWLGTDRRLLSCPGLDGEERWEFCDLILNNLGIQIDRDTEGFILLMDFLAGHPLAMRVILPCLEKLTIHQVKDALKFNLEALGIPESEDRAKLFAALQFAQDRIPADLKSLLIPLSMHERFFQTDMLKYMAEQVDPACTESRITIFIQALSASGLIWPIVLPAYEMHPALSGFLRAQYVSTIDRSIFDAWAGAFADTMARLADQLAHLELHVKRLAFHYHYSNFLHALAEAERIKGGPAQRAIVWSLAYYEQQTLKFKEAINFFLMFIELAKEAGDQGFEAAAYHHLGMIAAEQRDFEAARKWYLESLAIKEQQSETIAVANTYHQMGIVDQARGDFEAAERWYLKSLSITEKLGMEAYAASTYHQLGMITQKQRDFKIAEKWYLKSLAIRNKLEDEYGAASDYHQMGRIYEEHRDLKAAEQWYLKSLAITEKLGIEGYASMTYHQLGFIAEQQDNFKAAEKWYLASLAIKEKQGDELGAATTYHQLGNNAYARRDFALAEKWHLKSLAFEEKHGNEVGAAMSYHQLGIVAQAQGNLDSAKKWFFRALAIKEKQGDEHLSATTYGELGVTICLQGKFEEGGKWLIKCIKAFTKTQDAERAEASMPFFLFTYRSADHAAQARMRELWDAAGLGEFPEGEGG